MDGKQPSSLNISSGLDSGQFFMPITFQGAGYHSGAGSQTVELSLILVHLIELL